MAKVIVPLIVIAGLVIVIYLAVTQSSCPAGSYCPSGGGGSVSTDNGQYNPPDTDDQNDFHPEFSW